MTAEQERAAIVAWLRGEAGTDTGMEEHILWWAAQAIERGDHIGQAQEGEG